MEKRFFTISISYDTGEAEAKPSKNWDDYSGLLKSDILKDLIHDFESMYEDALREAFPKDLK